MTAAHLVLAAVTFLTAPCFAVEAPPAGPRDEAQALPSPLNAPGGFIASVRLGVLEVALAQTRLSQVRETVGAGIVDHQSDAQASLYWLCYTALAMGGPQRIWITSRDSHNGVAADSFTAERLGEGEGPSPACPALPPRFLPLSAGNEIWLGMTLAEIEHRIGAKSKRVGAYFVFSFLASEMIGRADEHLRRIGPEEAFILNRVVVEIVDGRAVRLWVHKVTTI